MHKTLWTLKRMYVPAAVCSHARSWAGRGGKGREGRKRSRKEECHSFTNRRKVTQPLSVSDARTISMTKNTLWLPWLLCQDGFHGVFSDHNQVLKFDRRMKSTVQTTSQRELSFTDITLLSNVTILMISYLLFPLTRHSVYCFSTAFPDVCKRRGTKFSLTVYSEKNSLGAPSCSYRKQTE